MDVDVVEKMMAEGGETAVFRCRFPTRFDTVPCLMTVNEQEDMPSRRSFPDVFFVSCSLLAAVDGY